MEERTLSCSLITPMFSYGAYREHPEFRTSQVKGIMRYVYRIACPWETRILKEKEGMLFGEAADGAGHASPVRLAVEKEKERQEKRTHLLLHDKKDSSPSGNDRGNPLMSCLEKDTVRLSVKVRPGQGGDARIPRTGADAGWYADLAVLSLTLCGLGKRSRKGRGAVAVENLKKMELEQAKMWILDTLNQTAGMISDGEKKPYYVFSDGAIQPAFNIKEIRRPVIQKIWFGNELRLEPAADFLKRIDKQCHEKLCGKGWTDEAKATGYADGGKRLASPLWISFMQVKDEVYPVYTCVKAYERKRELDADCAVREAFAARLERNGERR